MFFPEIGRWRWPVLAIPERAAQRPRVPPCGGRVIYDGVRAMPRHACAVAQGGGPENNRDNNKRSRAANRMLRWALRYKPAMARRSKVPTERSRRATQQLADSLP